MYEVPLVLKPIIISLETCTFNRPDTNEALYGQDSDVVALLAPPPDPDFSMELLVGKIKLPDELSTSVNRAKPFPEVPDVPSIPEVPEEPEVPLVPEDPEVPSFPLVPEDPLEPESPEEPLDPLDPEDPLEPDVPSAPEVPLVPLDPAGPVSPIGPVAPVGPIGPISPPSLENKTRSVSAIPFLYQYLYPVPPIMSLTSIDWNLIAESMELLAEAIASPAVAPAYGPDHESTGTGFTGCTPNGNCNPGVSDILYYSLSFSIFL